MRSLLYLPLALLAITPAFAQRTATRILGPINSTNYVRLQKSAHAAVLSRYDVGMAPANTEIRDAVLVLKKTPQQQQGLDAYIAGEMDPRSPDYHKWLTPQQFGVRYGLDTTYIAALVQWLESRGFTVKPVGPGRSLIFFSGTVANVESTFRVQIHQFNRDGLSFVSSMEAPAIPAALADVIQGISDLGTNRLQPLIKKGTPLSFNSKKRRFVPEGIRDGGDLNLVPADWATIYNAPNTLNANFNASSGKEYTGSGVTIGIVGIAPIDLTAVGNYRDLFIKPFLTSAKHFIYMAPVGSSGGPYTSPFSVEAFLDSEISGGLAPGATIIYYQDVSVDASLAYAIQADVADIISVSFGGCGGNYPLMSMAGLSQEAAAQGQAVVVGAGDNGSDGCDSNLNADEQDPGTAGLAVDDVSASAYSVAAGGTDFYVLGQDFNEYVSSKTNSNYGSVVGYIPETPWNDTISSPTTVAENTPNLNDLDGGAGGGGMSAKVAKPSWQVGPGVPDNSTRDTPDISLFAGNGFDGASTVICDDNPSTSAANAPMLNCAANSQGGFQADGVGGTSVAAPAFAGILAMVEQKTGGRLGNAVQELYALYNSKYGPSVFHSITTGNNSVPCKEGTPDCALDSAGFYYLTGYNAGPGYNLATGLGSVNITNLVNDWGATASSAPSLLNAAITSKITSGTVYNEEPTTVSVLVAAPASSDPAPTGTVTISAAGYTSSATTLTSGSATISIPSGSLQAGQQMFTIAYSGDSNYDPGDSSLEVTVLNPPAVTLAVSAPTAVAPGATAITQLQIQSTNGYVGSVTVSCTLTSSPTGAVSAPVCNAPTAPISLTNNDTTQAEVSFSTTAATQSKNSAPLSPWEKGGLGTALAAVLLLPIPSKNRAWRNMLCALLIASTIGLVTACGGKSGQPAPPPAPPTTAGTYTYTIQATGDPALVTQPVTTVAVTVN